MWKLRRPHLLWKSLLLSPRSPLSRKGHLVCDSELLLSDLRVDIVNVLAEESAAPTEPELTAEEATPVEASSDPAPLVEAAAAVEKHENGTVHTDAPHTEEKPAAAEGTLLSSTNSIIV